MVGFSSGRFLRLSLFVVLGLALFASTSAIDAPSSKPKQSLGKYTRLFLKPSKAEADVDAYAFVIPVITLRPQRISLMHRKYVSEIVNRLC
jgi:hypothetical protein